MLIEYNRKMAVAWSLEFLLADETSIKFHSNRWESDPILLLRNLFHGLCKKEYFCLSVSYDQGKEDSFRV